MDQARMGVKKPEPSSSSSDCFPVVMLPWFAFGHMTPFLHLANKLAEKGHQITFLLPNKARSQLQHFNHHPHLITIHSLTVPDVDGLPPGAETASDVPISSISLLVVAMDRCRDQVEAVIRSVKPKVVFFDTAYWVPEVSKPLGIKCINYNVVCAASIAIALVPARNVPTDRHLTEAELAEPPSGYPSEAVVLRRHEARALSFISFPFGDGMSFYKRITTSMKESDVIAVRTCYEIEGKLCEYMASQYTRPVLLTGPVLPEPDRDPLEKRWDKWLGGFRPGSVVYCAFGSQIILEKKQFQELLLGFELTRSPFLVSVKPPAGASTVEEALPEGFAERTKGRGVVCGEWVQQVAILQHPSVGCFVNHCGFGSMWESLTSDAQIVLVPQLGDQILNTRLMADELKVAVEVEREEDGWFSRENLCRAIKGVMANGDDGDGKENEVGHLVRRNHAKWKETLVSPGFMSGYIDKFVQDMRELVMSSDHVNAS